MWPNSGFGSNGSFQNVFNQDAFSGPGTSGSDLYFPQPTMMGYEEVDAFKEIQPQLGPYNNAAVFQNQQHFTNPGIQFSPHAFNVPQSMTPTPTPTPPRANQINARAAELKLQLLRSKEKARTATPKPASKIPGLASKQDNSNEGNALLRPPRTPTTTAEVHEQDLNALISQYSTDTKPTAMASVEQADNHDSDNEILQRLLGSITSNHPQEASTGSPKITVKANGNGALGNSVSTPSNASLSEGEIFDEPAPPKPIPSATENRKSQDSTSRTKPEGTSTHKQREEHVNTMQKRAVREEAMPLRNVLNKPKAQALPSSEDRRDQPESRTYTRSNLPYNGQDRKSQPEKDYRPSPRREFRDEEYQRAPITSEQKLEDISTREQKPPTLEALLAHDDDLREWLVITGYHNKESRDKILSRRRAIAALDAQRDKLIAELEAEERGGLPTMVGARSNQLYGLPATPNNTASRGEELKTSMTATQNIQRENPSSNKRAFSEVQDSRIDNHAGKIARTNSFSQNVKEDENYDLRQPRTNGKELSRRSSFDPRDDRDSLRGRFQDSHEDDDLQMRPRSRDRSNSPGRRAFGDRSAARRVSYDARDFRDRDFDDSERGPRRYEANGGYKGRSFDPGHRGRGRGRGRGEFQNYREPKSFNRGGKSGQ